MSQSLNLSQGGEYAIAALSRLALRYPEPMSVESLAGAQRIPRAFLAKILGLCAKAGFVRAKTGPAGGMSLARDPKTIPILEIIEACEGEFRRSDCVFYSERACDGPFCQVYCPLRRNEEDLRKGLKDTTLADMARSLMDHPLNNNGGREWTPRKPI